MREIKFRAWNDLKGMITNPMSMSTVVSRFIKEFRPAPTGFGSRAEEVKPDDYILMQYTGLKDKNGKEIYEGDVVKYGGASKGIGEVSWREAEFSIRADDDGSALFLPIRTTSVEVIGNIYENTELVSKEY